MLSWFLETQNNQPKERATLLAQMLQKMATTNKTEAKIFENIVLPQTPLTQILTWRHFSISLSLIAKL